VIVFRARRKRLLQMLYEGTLGRGARRQPYLADWPKSGERAGECYKVIFSAAATCIKIR
jgi:hypothetical protein